MKNYEKGDRVFIYDFDFATIHECKILDIHTYPSPFEKSSESYHIDVEFIPHIGPKQTLTLAYFHHLKHFTSFQNEGACSRYFAHYDKDELKQYVYHELLERMNTLIRHLRYLNKL